jgi:hypothetical protein
MLSEIKNYPVNWVDGMKISKRQFVEIENFVQDFIRDSIALRTNGYNYGLLNSPTNTSSYELFVHIDTQSTISVKMTFCRAITNSGQRIELINTTSESAIVMRASLGKLIEDYALQATLKNELYITLSINPSKKIPFGEATNEIPPRYPFSKADYQLSIIPRDYINSSEYSSSHLIVAKLIYENNEVYQETGYIPPCTSMRSFPKLNEWHAQFDGLLTSLENSSIKIMQKIKLKPEKKSPLSENINGLMDKLVFTIATGITEYRNILPDEPPIKTINLFAQMAKVFKTYINTLTSINKEEILKYFGSWAEVPPAVIDGGMDSLIYMRYDHHEIKTALDKVNDIWQIIDMLLNKLTQLEYIGEQRGKQIFVIENPVHRDKAPVEPIKSKFNPLD